MLEFLKSLPAVLLIAGFIVYGKNPPERSFSPVGVVARLEIVNNTLIDLPAIVQAPAVDSASRFLGIVPKCSRHTFKLPYADTRVVLIVADASFDINVDDLKTYAVVVSSGDVSQQCREVVKVASRVIEFVDPLGWRSSSWFRLNDVLTPVKVVIAGDETACVIWEIEVTPVRVGDYYACKTKWRGRQ